MKNKKAVALSQLPAAVIIIVIIGVVAVVGTSINDSLKNTSVTAATVTNESITSWANNTYESLANKRAISITSIANATTTIGSANYTLTANSSASAVKIVYADAAGLWATGTYNVSYTYNSEDDAFVTAGNASLGIIEITQNLQLLGLIVVMGAVIAILLASFGGFITGKSSGGL